MKNKKSKKLWTFTYYISKKNGFEYWRHSPIGPTLETSLNLFLDGSTMHQGEFLLDIKSLDVKKKKAYFYLKRFKVLKIK